jgi:hypothetical protein
MIKKKEEVVVESKCDCKKAIKDLLIKKSPAIFDREPSPNFNANLDDLVEELIKLTC